MELDDRLGMIVDAQVESRICFGRDDQQRGRLLAALRAAPHPVTRADLLRAVPDDVVRDPLQRDRALASRVADGLVESLPDGYTLPA